MRTVILLAALLVFTSQAAAKPNNAEEAEEKVTTESVSSEAGKELMEGLQRYEAGDYETARAFFQRGYDLDPKPDFLFALGQTERLSGDCSSALVFYRRFLLTEPAELHADLATQMIEKCEIALSSSPEARRVLEEKARSETHAATPILQVGPATTILIDYESWHRDVIGVSLLSTSVAALLAGSSFLWVARSNSSAAESASSYRKHSDLLDRAERQQTIGFVGLGVGSALLTTTALYYVFRDRPKRVRNIEVNASDDALTASLTLAF